MEESGQKVEENCTSKLVDAAQILIGKFKMAGLHPVLLFGRKKRDTVFSECLDGLGFVSEQQRGVVKAIQILYKSLLAESEEVFASEHRDRRSTMDEDEPEVLIMNKEEDDYQEKAESSQLHRPSHAEVNVEDCGEPEVAWNSGPDGLVANMTLDASFRHNSFNCHEYGQELTQDFDLRKKMMHTGEKTFGCSIQRVGEVTSAPRGAIDQKEHSDIKQEEEDVSIHQEEADVLAVTLQSEEDEEKPMSSHFYHGTNAEENSKGPEPPWNSGPGEHLVPGMEDRTVYASETEETGGYREATNELLWLKTEENTPVVLQDSSGVRGETGGTVCYSDFGQQIAYNTLSLMRENTWNLFSCSLCGKGFRQKGGLICHMRIHSGVKPYGCSVCGKRFIQKSHLTAHEKIHTEEKLFSCSECGKRFKHKSALWAHKKIHTGWKPYSCSFCGKRFMHKFHLTPHERTHTGEKLFSCDECGKKFRRTCDLSRHKKSHTGEKPFSCSECDKRFTQRSSLRRHEIIHARKRNYLLGLAQ